MVPGRLGAQHHPPEVRQGLTRPVGVSTRRDRTIGRIWTLSAIAVAIVLLAALVVVARDPSAELVARWTLTVFWLVAPLLWLARRHRASLRRYFGR